MKESERDRESESDMTWRDSWQTGEERGERTRQTALILTLYAWLHW